MREADNHTIGHRPVSSIDLMEAASMAFVEIFKESYPDKEKQISVYCGTGNNGGDGLAIARLLSEEGYDLSVKIARFNRKASADFDINLGRLKESGVFVRELFHADDFQENAGITIDALLGSGLNKPLAGEWQKLVQSINRLNTEVVAVDVPSGFPGEGPLASEAIHADLVISFQRPKINFFLPESANFVKRFAVTEIGLDEDFIQSCETPYRLIIETDIRPLLRAREPFSHKGSYGHALIIAGAAETMGAALLCSEACLHTGAGLTTACIPASGLTALNVRIPEVMAALRHEGQLPDLEWDKFSAVGIGPGLGTGIHSRSVFEETLKGFRKPLVLDADAINLLSTNAHFLDEVPPGSIFTPHVKEFDRLFGEHAGWWGRLQTGLKEAERLRCVIVLKNRFTFIFTPEGKCLINPTGSPAMATGGSGDVLTGIITSLLAQGYLPEQAAMLGVYIHGLCGERVGKNSVVATAQKVINIISSVIKDLTGRSPE